MHATIVNQTLGLCTNACILHPPFHSTPSSIILYIARLTYIFPFTQFGKLQTSRWMFWAVGPHQCSTADQNNITQSHTFLTPTGPFNLIPLSCITTPCADNVGTQNVASFCTSTHTYTHTCTHTPAFTHLGWCRLHEQFFRGGVYVCVYNIAPSIHDHREPRRRNKQTPHFAHQTCTHTGTKYKYLNRALQKNPCRVRRSIEK